MSEDPTQVVSGPSATPDVHATPKSRLEPTKPLGRGDEVARYVILDPVGAGGMGQVYAAYDPELDRKVALKLLLRSGARGRGATEGEARLLREAQAMAKLTHPNVVAVYDAGTIEDRVFIAMEFVEGMTLKEWLERATSGWRTKIGPFLSAGRGLAAAHEVGLVHRDFKPANVMIKATGEVRVLDFGLARQLSAEESIPVETESLELSQSSQRLLHTDQLTRTGLVSGTPAYMAPEQFRGDIVDARTDQFAYCVALYEALYGTRPFGSPEYKKLAAAVQLGKVEDPPGGSGVPTRVRKILLRGLAPDSEDRFATMQDLLDALESAVTPWHRRPVTWAAVAGAATIGVTASVFAAQPAPADPCPDPTPKLQGVWDDARADQTVTAFEATGLVYAGDAAQRSKVALDAFAERWVAAHRDACEATHVRHEQSDALLDRRIACLGERLAELDAVGDLFVEADATTVEKAVTTALGLGGIDSCADTARLTAAIPPPSDPSLAAEVEELRKELARLKVMSRSGQLMMALERGAALLERARATEHEPIIAEMMASYGSIQAATGQPEEGADKVREALLMAEALGHSELEFTTRVSLIAITGYRTAKHDEAHRHAKFARALRNRVSPRDDAQGMLELSEGITYHSEGKAELALESLEAALKIKEEVMGADHPDVANVLVNMGSILVGFHRYEDADKAFRRAIEIYRASMGDLHPQLGTAIHNLGLLHMMMGDYDESRALVDQALGIWRQVLPPGHSDLALAEQSLGVIAIKTGDPATALEHYRRSVETKVQSLGEIHPSVAIGRGNIADALNRLGRFEEGLAAANLAKDVAEKAVGLEHPILAAIFSNRGEAQLGLGDVDAAEKSLELSLARFERVPSDPADTGRIRVLLGRIQAKRGNLEEARALADEAMKQLRPRGEAASQEIAEAEALLAELGPAQ